MKKFHQPHQAPHSSEQCIQVFYFISYAKLCHVSIIIVFAQLLLAQQQQNIVICLKTKTNKQTKEKLFNVNKIKQKKKLIYMYKTMVPRRMALGKTPSDYYSKRRFLA
jgi:hypothetical protein